MTEVTTGATRQPDTENWLLLMDPAWQPKVRNEEPPTESMVGLWPVDAAGKVGKFRANPGYVPSDDNSPTDPLDAVFHLLIRGEADNVQLQHVLRDTFVDVAMTGETHPVIASSPDNVSCVVVATGEPHRLRFAAPAWRRVDLDELVELLADGIDVWFNPDGPAGVRLTGDFLRVTVLLTEEDLAEVSPDEIAAGLRVTPWDMTAGTD